MRPDIVFVKPGSQKQIYGDLSAFELTAIEPPLWAALLAGYMRDKGYGVEILDAELENLSYEDTARRIQEMNPVLCVLTVSGTNPSASTMNMTGAGKILSHVRELAPGVKTLIMGLHPSALPAQTLKEEPCDFLCQGEGFLTLPALVDAIKNKAGSFDIPGLWYWKEGQMVEAPRPPMLKDLAIPMPAWDLLPMEQYRAHNWHCFDGIEKRQPYAVLYTSLGCPYNCSFCCINALFGKHTIRYRPIPDVVEEIDTLVNRWGVRNIKIMDEMFALDEKRVTALCDAIIARGYDLNFWAYARVNTVTKPMLAKMKEAGIHWIAYGFESGSERVIKNVTKGYRMDRVDEVVRMTYELGQYICANFIFGLPEDDYDSMNETLARMIEINAQWANIYSAMAYPGSRLYDEALENGWRLPETWEAFSQYSAASRPLPTKYLTGGQVLSFRDYAFNAYYRSPRYLSMIRKTFGQATMDHIQEMASTDLTRNNAEI